MIIRELAARLGLDIDGAAFEAADALLGTVRSGLVAVGAFAGTAALGLAAAVAKTAEYADQVEKASQRTGIGVEALQALQYAAERADVGLEGLQGALNFMAKRGVTDFEAELRRAADELSRMPPGGARAARAIQLLGRQGAMLLPMLVKGSAGLDEMTAKARDMGLVLSRDGVSAGAELKDAIEDLQGYLRGLVYAIAGPLLGVVRPWLETLSAWVRANRGIIATRFEQFARGLGVAVRWTWRIVEPFVRLLVAFASNTWVVRAAIVALATALLAALGGAAASAASAVMKLIGALMGLTAAEIASAAVPVLIGAALLGLALIVEDVFRFIRGERSLLGQLADDIHRVYGTTLAIDPNDNPLVIWLKNVGQALDRIKAALLTIANAPGWLGKLAGLQQLTSSPYQFGGKLAADLLARGALDDRGKSAYFGGPMPGPSAVPYYLAAPGVNVREIYVTVQAPPNADPQRFGYDIGAAIREQLGMQIEAAGGALLLRPSGG